MKLCLSVLLVLMTAASPALAKVEQCRFLQARADREACYQRQEAALAEKRKQTADRSVTTTPALEPLSPEDVALKAKLRSICRGC